MPCSQSATSALWVLLSRTRMCASSVRAFVTADSGFPIPTLPGSCHSLGDNHLASLIPCFLHGKMGIMATSWKRVRKMQPSA